VRFTVSAALDIVTHRPENAWAADFVFQNANDPAGDISMLTNPLPVSNSELATVRETAVPGEAYDGQCDISVAYTMIPAFTVGALTVGLSIHRVNPICHTLYSDHPPAVYAVGRFVRDERTAETLIVSTNMSRTNAPGSSPAPALISGVSTVSSASNPAFHPRTSIIYLRHDSSTQRSHLFAACDPELFARGRYAESVVFAESEVQVRFCPVCNASPAAKCGCALPLRVPKSALDFSAFLPNCKTHYGSFHSKSNVSFRNGLAAAFGRAVSSKMGLCSQDSDKSIAQLLQNLAIQDRMERVCPSRTIMPAAGQTASGDPAVLEKLSSASHTPSPSPSSDTPNCGSADLSDALGAAWIDGVDLADDMYPRILLPPDADGGWAQSQADPPPLPHEAFGQGEVLDFMDIVSVVPDCAISASVAEKHQQSATAIVTSPVPTAYYVASPVEVPVQQPSADVAVKSAKQLERQRKNREAASRSNAKRKLVMDTLKEQVDDARKSILLLQEKEAKLKADNQALKDIAARRWREEIRSANGAND
jgi:hypothetical protein